MKRQVLEPARNPFTLAAVAAAPRGRTGADACPAKVLACLHTSHGVLSAGIATRSTRCGNRAMLVATILYPATIGGTPRAAAR